MHSDRSQTLRQVGEELNISHERVRQIKEKVIKKLISKNNKSLLESSFKQEVKKLLANYHSRDHLGTEYINAPQKYIFQSSLLPTGEKCLTISEGNNKIIIAESDFQEFYRNLLNNFKTHKIEDIRKKHQRAYEKWTKEEDEFLKHHLTEGLNIKEIAELLARQPTAIASRINKLGLS